MSIEAYLAQADTFDLLARWAALSGQALFLLFLFIGLPLHIQFRTRSVENWTMRLWLNLPVISVAVVFWASGRALEKLLELAAQFIRGAAHIGETPSAAVIEAGLRRGDASLAAFMPAINWSVIALTAIVVAVLLVVSARVAGRTHLRIGSLETGETAP